MLFSSTLGVCAYVILFSVLTRLADCSGLLPFLVNVLSSLLPGENAPVLCRSFLCWPYGAFHRYRGHKGWGIFPFVAASGGVYLGMGWSVSTLPVSALLAGGRGTIRALSPR